MLLTVACKCTTVWITHNPAIGVKEELSIRINKIPKIKAWNVCNQINVQYNLQYKWPKNFPSWQSSLSTSFAFGYPQFLLLQT